MFAKLYEPVVGQQILVKLDEYDDGFEVRVYCQPEGLGVCSTALKYPDTEGGWDKAQKAFDSMTEEKAIEIAGMVMKMTSA